VIANARVEKDVVAVETTWHEFYHVKIAFDVSV
jgi:hypothetical protein